MAAVTMPDNIPVKIGEKYKRGNEIWYISDIMYSLQALDWLVCYVVVDEKDIVIKQSAISLSKL